MITGKKVYLVYLPEEEDWSPTKILGIFEDKGVAENLMKTFAPNLSKMIEVPLNVWHHGTTVWRRRCQECGAVVDTIFKVNKIGGMCPKCKSESLDYGSEVTKGEIII